MIFIVSGQGETAPVSRTCETPGAALEQARRLLNHGIRDVLIDADGHEYDPAEFRRLFIGLRLVDSEEPAVGLDSQER
jgi:hypothetical protein